MSEQPSEPRDYPKFHDPSVRDRDGRLLRHKFVDGSPRYTVCMACGGGPEMKMSVIGPFVHL